MPANGTLTRIVPVNGLLIDAEIWAAAHDFHRYHQQRHSLLLHGPGIAAGLEVAAHEPPNRTLVIYPGLALDSAGNPILLNEVERYTVQTEQPGPIFIVLQFREVASGARGPAGPGVPTHLREAYRILEFKTPPNEPHVELARVWLTGAREPLTDAPDPFAPGPNQIDQRHRPEAGGLARGEISVGHAWPDNMPTPLHTALPLRLVQSLATTSSYRTRFVGQLPPAEAARRCCVLYLAGQGPLALSGADIDGFKAFLDSGGTIFGDGDANDPFSASFGQLAERLGRTLQPVERNASIMRAPHLFTAPPPGSTAGGLLMADGIIFSGADYGAAMEGGRPGQALDRATIRAVQEIVTNIAFYAYARQRTVQYAESRRAL